jgi:hypothetical protein
MPGFLKLFTVQEDRISLLYRVIRQAAFDLYFRSDSIGIPTPPFVAGPGLSLHADFPSLY